MKYRLPAIVPLLCSLLCGAVSTTVQAEGDPAYAASMVKRGALVVDVRSAAEYAQGHVPQASHIPYEEVVARFAEQGISKEQTVVLYCASGRRAEIARQALEQAGYQHVINGGGFRELRPRIPNR